MAQYASTLDVEGTVKIAPDLVWLDDGQVRACIDVKYKVEKHGQYPNADLYQMAAYCRRFGLKEGHLVFAGPGSEYSSAELMHGLIVTRSPVDLNEILIVPQAESTQFSARVVGEQLREKFRPTS
ncbi:5-methylcytosine restriction system specificity protein McrC [Curtobacterium oceanosedimentum]|uniref:5-methylcytosine restriction system specificity protein McrC n=1 Tax=Curtobacterium oceanosedimentum TaxID=465820 RepID=UPI0007371B3F|nr:hypothetical protein [Curtobacterium oceanosedimentum]